MTDPESPSKHPVMDVVDRLSELTESDTLVLRDLVEAFGTTSYVPALMVPSILVVSPLSGIPVFSTICGLTIALVATQMLLAREHLWLPDWLMRRSVDAPRLRQAMGGFRRAARWIDRHSRHRLRVLTTLPGVLVPRVLAVVCGLAMPLLELVPFSSSLLGTATLLFAVSFLSRDGIYVVAGIAVMGIAASVPMLVFSALTG